MMDDEQVGAGVDRSPNGPQGRIDRYGAAPHRAGMIDLDPVHGSRIIGNLRRVEQIVEVCGNLPEARC